MTNIFKLSDIDLFRLEADVRDELHRRSVPARDTLSEIKGQEMGKRALLVALAGHHSILFIGGVGVGKSMLRSVAAAFDWYKTAEARPCPCGYRNDPRRSCSCQARSVHDHVRKFPRCDITIELPPVPAREFSSTLPGTSIEDFQSQLADMSRYKNRELSVNAQRLLDSATSELGLSADEHARIRSIARTIANLDKFEHISTHHLMESINYRPLSFSVL